MPNTPVSVPAHTDRWSQSAGPAVSLFAQAAQCGDSAPAFVQQDTRASVLVVEGDYGNARVMSALLEGAGYVVTVVHSAGAAQESTARILPDLVLCGVRLPDMDGIRLTQWLRKRAGHANMPIVLIISSDDGMTLSEGLDAGADDFLAKPVNALELRTRVRSLLRTKVLADELRICSIPLLADGEHLSVENEFGDICNDPSNAVPSVLVVEDNVADRLQLQAHLSDLRCDTRVAESAADGLSLARERAPDLIILDLVLPDCCGYDFIGWLKADPCCAQVPILVVSALADIQARVKALELGADDFIVEGFERSEFVARARRLLRLKRSLDHLSTRCNRALRRAITDSLTGLFTYGFMHETLRSQLCYAQRHGKPYSLIFADIDHFKQINDRYGHATGDAVLRAVAQVLLSGARQSDTVVRYGGEEFMILLPHTNRDDAMVLADRMRDLVAVMKVPVDGVESLFVTISAGVASYPDNAADGKILVDLADEAMYIAKRSGRNRVVAAREGLAGQRPAACVLVVEHDDESLRLLKNHLVSEGYQILRASTGPEAIDVAQKQRPDLVVIDTTMPYFSGYDICRWLKQDSHSQSLPVLLVTDAGARGSTLHGIEVNADGVLSKSVEKVELLTRVRNLIRNRDTAGSLQDAEHIVFALARAVEGRDPLLGNHVERVAHYAVSFGKTLGLAEQELDALRRGAIVHDIGKIALPDAILLKPTKLTSEEFQIVQQHPETGYRLLLPLASFSDALPAVRFHHERLDGSGYPLGLRGNEIPLVAQIVAIADVYDAITAPRCYRDAMAINEAFEVLRGEAQRGFYDRRLIETFITRVAWPANEGRECASANSVLS